MSIAPVYAAFNCANLWDEMENGPLKTAIAPKITSGDDQGIANLLNDKAGAADGSVNHADVAAATISGQIDWIEYDAALTAGKKSTFDSIQAAGVVPVGGANVQGFYDATFTSGSCPNTRTGLQSLYTQTGSRAEVAFGTGTSVTAQQVNIARTTSGAGSF